LKQSEQPIQQVDGQKKSFNPLQGIQQEDVKQVLEIKVEELEQKLIEMEQSLKAERQVRFNDLKEKNIELESLKEKIKSLEEEKAFQEQKSKMLENDLNVLNEQIKSKIEKLEHEVEEKKEISLLKESKAKIDSCMTNISGYQEAHMKHLEEVTSVLNKKWMDIFLCQPDGNEKRSLIISTKDKEITGLHLKGYLEHLNRELKKNINLLPIGFEIDCSNCSKLINTAPKELLNTLNILSTNLQILRLNFDWSVYLYHPFSYMTARQFFFFI